MNPNEKRRKRNLPYVGEGKDFEVKKGEGLKDQGYPHSTSLSSQPSGKPHQATRNYIREAFQKAGINNVDDLSKVKTTSLAGEVILDRMRGNTKWTKEGAMKEHKAYAQLNGKGNWTKEGAMAERKAAAQAQGKGNWNAEEEMKKRRAAASKPTGTVRNAPKPTGTVSNAPSKGKWNAEEEMRKRREAAQAQGKGSWNAEEEMRKRREAAMAKKKGK
jgi:hypothetical protein